jgi:hypothetical protein
MTVSISSVASTRRFFARTMSSKEAFAPTPSSSIACCGDRSTAAGSAPSASPLARALTRLPRGTPPTPRHPTNTAGAVLARRSTRSTRAAGRAAPLGRCVLQQGDDAVLRATMRDISRCCVRFGDLECRDLPHSSHAHGATRCVLCEGALVQLTRGGHDGACQAYPEGLLREMEFGVEFGVESRSLFSAAIYRVSQLLATSSAECALAGLSEGRSSVPLRGGELPDSSV